MTTQLLQKSRVGLPKNTDKVKSLEDIVEDVSWELAPLKIISAYLEKLVGEAACGGEDGRVSLGFQTLLMLYDGVNASRRNIEKALDR